MSYGIQLRNASGNIFFNTDSTTWNFIGSFIANAYETITVNLPAISKVTNTLVQKFFVDEAPRNQEAFTHTVTINGTAVTAAAGAMEGKVRTLVIVLGR